MTLVSSTEEAMTIPDKSIQISIDRGGTFTDVHVSYPSTDPSSSSTRQEWVIKLLSVDPAYEDAPREGIRRALEHVLKTSIPRHQELNTDKIDYIRLSTTVATNALLERKGSNHALLITKGFKDLLKIGNQSRPKIFDLAIRRSSVLYEKVMEIDERVTLLGYTSDPLYQERSVKFNQDGQIIKSYDHDGLKDGDEESVVKGISGEAVRVIKRLDEDVVRSQLKTLREEGYESLAVVLMHSFTYPGKLSNHFVTHEKKIEEIAKSLGFSHISISSNLMPMIKLVTRGTSTTADAYLTPILKQYLHGFFSGFDHSLQLNQTNRTRVEFMRSDGGLTDLNGFSGLHSVLSGPAGGVVGYALTTFDPNERIPVIGLDMGGTSTDVSRFDGRYETVFETTTAGVTIQSPQLDINTVAAGGGSRLFWRNGLFITGPESAGADPGPACYRKGGPLTVTDANLILGRLVVNQFPKIFGKNENQGLDEEVSERLFQDLTQEINTELDDSTRRMSLDEVAWGFVKIANETMCRPIRALTEARGYDTSRHVLSPFGGAGGQHACDVARTLGIRRIVIHRHSSILSAYGMALADRVVERQTPCSAVYETEGKGREGLLVTLQALQEEVHQELIGQGFKENRIVIERYLNLRYDGTDTALMILESQDDEFEFVKAFEESYRQEFGESLGKTYCEELSEITFQSVDDRHEPDQYHSVYFDQPYGRQDRTPVYLLNRLSVGDLIKGPALLIDDFQTLVIDPEAEAKVLKVHIVIDMMEKLKQR
ncbi:Hydantoinase/oxoprolinase-domain-containing protein [Melampsora americana]|nr:Hydantoinase/oxoprolinase-domain-containing protein [Melampsora americana]